MPTTPNRVPLTPDDAIDRALAAHAAAPPGAMLGGVRFWSYADGSGPFAGSAAFELAMTLTYSDVPDPALDVAVLERNHRAERLEIIRAWRKAFYDERRPRPSDIATPSSRPGRGDA